MQPVCVPLLPTPTSSFKKIGGDEENRTPDPLLAKQVLSQLSYTPAYLIEGLAPSKLNNDLSFEDLTLDTKHLMCFRSP